MGNLSAGDKRADMNQLNRSEVPPRRLRMSPSERRRLILDATAQVVTTIGVSAVSMELIAREANVSKALVYAYFDNRANLLAQLLLREFPAFQGDAVIAGPDEDFETIVRRTTVDFIDRFVAKGMLIQRLLAEPQVAESVADAQLRGRDATAHYFGELMTQSFGVPAEQATLAADMLMGVTGAAARMHLRTGADHDLIIELTVRMLLGAAKALRPAN